jgi:hypothetical protein
VGSDEGLTNTTIKRKIANQLKRLMEVGDTYSSVIERLLKKAGGKQKAN